MKTVVVGGGGCGAGAAAVGGGVQPSPGWCRRSMQGTPPGQAG